MFLFLLMESDMHYLLTLAAVAVVASSGRGAGITVENNIPEDAPFVAAPIANPFAGGCANGNCPPTIRYSASAPSVPYTGRTSVAASSGVRSGPVRRLFGAIFRGRLSRGGCR